MILDRVSTENYRNLQGREIALGRRLNVLWGDNAQGKTNFLEAVHMLCCQRSFRGSRAVEVIAFGHMSAMIRGMAEVGGLTRELEVSFTPGGRRLAIDGKGIRGGSSKLDGLSAVVFSPEDLQVPRGSPAERRRLVDRAIVALWPAYQQLQRDYGKTLQTRNRLLRQADLSPDASQLLDVYDAQLCELGARLTATRRRYLRSIGDTFDEVFGDISRTPVKGQLAYRTRPEVLEASDDLQQLATALRRALAGRRAEELARKTTCAGPHTDDIAFTLDGRDARLYGSQGQVRSMVLAFKLTQMVHSERRMGHYPLLLLDDVSSELDPQRSAHLFEFIRSVPCQVLLTTTREEMIPIPENSTRFMVEKGAVWPVNAACRGDRDVVA